MRTGLLLFGLLFFMATAKAQTPTWYSVDAGQGFDGGVYCLLSDDTGKLLYAGGFFKQVDGTTVNNVAKWDGTKWSPMGAGLTGTNSVVYALAIYQNELYAGGHFTQSGSTALSGIAKWDGTQWVDVGGGISTGGAYDFVSCMTVFNGHLYIGGEFSSTGSLTTDNVAKWDGSKWAAVGGGLQAGASGRANALHVFQNELYVGGHFFSTTTAVGLQYRIAKLKGNAWINVGTIGLGDPTDNWNVRSMATYKDALYAGGYFNVLEDGPQIANHMAKWDGSAWSTLGNAPNIGIQTQAPFGPVRAILPYNGKLYVGGTFTGAGGVASENLATWDGKGWAKVSGSDLDGEITSMAVYNGNLVIAGNFKKAGGATRNSIAMLNSPNGIDQITQQIATSLFPNPFSNSAVLTVNAPQTLRTAILTIYDMTGRKVKTIKNLLGNKIEINADHLVPGRYHYQLKVNNEMIAAGNFVFR